MKKHPKVLLVIPPVMQFNSAYPSIPMLTAFLHSQGYQTAQTDAGLELILQIFSRSGLKIFSKYLNQNTNTLHPSVKSFIHHFDRYADTIDAVMLFLQNKDPELAYRIVTRSFLPEGPRFEILNGQPSMDWLLDNLGTQDQAKHLASLYIDDLADMIKYGIDERFELSRYAEKLAASLSDFSPLKNELKKPPTLIDRMIDNISTSLIKTHQPDLVGFTVPFPGNLYATLRMAQQMKKNRPAVKIAIGGGYINTELRSLHDPDIFDIVDYITLDDGETPLLQILKSIQKPSSDSKLVRTFIRQNNKVSYINARENVSPQTCTPVFDGMLTEKRIGLMELPNPMYRLWSDGGWNKLMLAHGCYWHQCSFCDTKLDYIRKYRPEPAKILVNRMESIVNETGQYGFHFVDEAAPPALLRAVAKEILRRKLTVTWWSNIRFENNFTPELTQLLSDSGCIAVTGGLETVCDRTLAMMRKGITVEQALQVAANFTSHNIMVHAYLMYGFPSQTIAETIDALEIVRQMFDCGCLQSAYWHRFALTIHSPMAANPADFGIQLASAQPAAFAQNEILYKDLSKTNPEPLASGLRKAMYNFMHGTGIENDIRTWFDSQVPRPRIKRKFVANLLFQ